MPGKQFQYQISNGKHWFACCHRRICQPHSKAHKEPDESGHP